MVYENSDHYKINLDVKCANKVISLISPNSEQIEKCLNDSFSTTGDYTSENQNLKEDANQIKILNTHYQNPNLFIDG